MTREIINEISRINKETIDKLQEISMELDRQSGTPEKYITVTSLFKGVEKVSDAVLATSRCEDMKSGQHILDRMLTRAQ